MTRNANDTDEVREASGSGDLARMLRALDLPAHPIDRHFLLLHVVEITYSQRHDDTEMRELCRQVAERHIDEFSAIVEAFKSESPGGLPPMVPTFQHLATVLTEEAQYDKAVGVCERAISYGIIDGTKSGFQGRTERIRKQQQVHSRSGVKPQPRRCKSKLSPEDMRAQRSKVPRFKEYSPTTEEMNERQRRFYDTWREAWERGDVVPVDGNISYLFCYVYRLFRRSSSTREPVGLVGGSVSKAAIPYLITRLQKLIEAYRDSEPTFAAYCKRWWSDCHVVKRDYGTALQLYPRPTLGRRSSASTDSLLSLKLAVDEQVDGHDLLTLVGAQVSRWGSEHLAEIRTALNRLAKDHEERFGVNLLASWARHAHSYPYTVFGGSPFASDSGLTAYSFSDSAPAQKLIRNLTREAENAVRAELGHPPVRQAKRR